MTSPPAPQRPEAQENPDLNEDERSDLDEAEPQAERVSYSGTDFDVEGLVRRLDRGDIVIPRFGQEYDGLDSAAFQRAFVWRKNQMDRFIESLLLGYPIPGIMLMQQLDKRYLVLDGQQRLSTLSAFCAGEFRGDPFKLINVAHEYQGLTYESLDPDQRRTLNNTFIQAMIVKTDESPGSLEAVYQVFERLNSGGTQLTPNEIRIALFSGKFIEFLAKLNKTPSWRKIYGPPSARQRDHELLLRIFALYSRSPEYKRPLKKFLNDFVAAHRNLDRLDTVTLEKTFILASDKLAEANAQSAMRPTGRLNAALLESVFVAAMKEISSGRDLDHASVRDSLNRLAQNSEMLKVISGSTAGEDSVQTRLRLAAEAFADS